MRSTDTKLAVKKWIPIFIKKWLLNVAVRFKCSRLKTAKIQPGVSLDMDTILEGNISIGPNTDIRGAKIGCGSYVAGNCHMPSTDVGRFCSIGPGLRTCLGSHPTETFVSTHPAFFSTAAQAGFTFVASDLFVELKKISDGRYVVRIGNDVWIGANVTILDGVTVGDGAIIGAGSIVTRDIEPYSICVGVPARKVRYRFDEETIRFLLATKWWTNDFDWIAGKAEQFADIARFKDAFDRKPSGSLGGVQ